MHTCARRAKMRERVDGNVILALLERRITPEKVGIQYPMNECNVVNITGRGNKMKISRCLAWKWARYVWEGKARECLYMEIRFLQELYIFTNIRKCRKII